MSESAEWFVRQSSKYETFLGEEPERRGRGREGEREERERGSGNGKWEGGTRLHLKLNLVERKGRGARE